MEIFTLSNNQPIVTTEALLIKQFKDLYDRDRSKNKDLAHKELAWVYFTTDYKSKYLTYDIETREEILKEDLNLNKTWEPDELIKLAQDKYDQLQQTPTLNYLRSMLNAQQKSTDYFNSVDYSLLDAKGRPVYTIEKINSAMANAAKVVDTIEKLKEKVEKEQSISTKFRGNQEASFFEFE
jgi:hypothetical protein